MPPDPPSCLTLTRSLQPPLPSPPFQNPLRGPCCHVCLNGKVATKLLFISNLMRPTKRIIILFRSYQQFPRSMKRLSSIKSMMPCYRTCHQTCLGILRGHSCCTTMVKITDERRSALDPPTACWGDCTFYLPYLPSLKTSMFMVFGAIPSPYCLHTNMAVVRVKNRWRVFCVKASHYWCPTIISSRPTSI